MAKAKIPTEDTRPTLSRAIDRIRRIENGVLRLQANDAEEAARRADACEDVAADLETIRARLDRVTG